MPVYREGNIINIFSVLLMVLAFHYFGLDLTSGTIHTTFGVIIFVLALGLLFAVKKGDRQVGRMGRWDGEKMRRWGARKDLGNGEHRKMPKT